MEVCKGRVVMKVIHSALDKLEPAANIIAYDQIRFFMVISNQSYTVLSKELQKIISFNSKGI
jgi:hypothetical protein